MEKTKIESKKISVFYGEKKALSGISLDIPEKRVTSLIGPSGCGKSTFLRCLNRMNDTIDICRIEGKILVDGEDIYDRKLDPVLLRARIGMVFQKLYLTNKQFKIIHRIIIIKMNSIDLKRQVSYGNNQLHHSQNIGIT